MDVSQTLHHHHIYRKKYHVKLAEYKNTQKLHKIGVLDFWMCGTGKESPRLDFTEIIGASVS